MTRHMLTTATLAAFFASDPAAALDAETVLPAPLTSPSRHTQPSVEILTIDDRLMAVHAVSARPGTLAVALQLETTVRPPSGLWVWAGTRQGWGSRLSAAIAHPGLPGFYEAQLSVPAPLPAQARLWIACDRPGRRLATAWLPLPSV